MRRVAFLIQVHLFAQLMSIILLYAFRLLRCRHVDDLKVSLGTDIPCILFISSVIEEHKYNKI